MTRNEYMIAIQAKADEMAADMEELGFTANAERARKVPEAAKALPDSRFIGDADALFGNILRAI